jgi:nucleoside phosphorylase
MIDTLLVAPMAREAAALGRGAVACGAGESAAGGVSDYLREHPARLVVIAGVCGGLDPSLGPGDVVLGRRLVAPGAPDLIADSALFDAAKDALHARRLPFVQSLLLTVVAPVAKHAEKRDLWNTYGAAGVDMETYDIARAVEASGARWIAVRTVLDTASSSLPASLRDWSGTTSDRDVLRAALRKPGEWPAYVRLALAMRSALGSLTRTVPIIATAAAAAARTAPASISRATSEVLVTGDA